MFSSVIEIQTNPRNDLPETDHHISTESTFTPDQTAANGIKSKCLPAECASVDDNIDVQEGKWREKEKRNN